MIPTLFLVSVLIFVLAQVLPGDIGRTMLGPDATPQAVQALDRQLGADRPIAERYISWAGNFVTGRWGESPVLEEPVFPTVISALGNSLLLAAVALIVILPLSILLGVGAGLRKDSSARQEHHHIHAIAHGHPRVR